MWEPRSRPSSSPAGSPRRRRLTRRRSVATRASTRRAHRLRAPVVAPGLRVISTQWGLGNCPTTFFISARAADGTIWSTDYNDSLWKSTDDLRTIQRTYTATGYVADRSGPAAGLGHDSDRGHRLERRAARAALHRLEWHLVCPHPGAGPAAPGPRFTTATRGPRSTAPFTCAQYGGGPPVNLWKSSDDGRTFAPVWQGDGYERGHRKYDHELCRGSDHDLCAADRPPLPDR